MLIMLFSLIKIATAGYEVGDIVPEFSLVHFQQNAQSQHDILENKGNARFIVINFFGSACQSCITEIPKLADLANTKNHPLVRLVSIDKNADQLKEYLAKHKISLEVGHDSQRTVFKAFGLKLVPALYVFDKNRKIVFKHNDELDDTVITHLQEELNK